MMACLPQHVFAPMGRRAFLFAAGAAALVACSSTRQVEHDGPGVVPTAGDGGSPDGGDTVVMVGDSLTDVSAPELADAFSKAGFAALRIDGASSRRIAVDQQGGPTSGITAVEGALAAGLRPRSWVIALGTNDVSHYERINDFAAVVERLLDAIPDDAMVVWVDVYLRDFPGQTDVFNTTLGRVVAGRSDSVVCEWSARAAETGLVGDDGIHLTEAGNAAFATAVTEALRLRQG